MGSHVVVIDSSARRATVKTSPGMFLSEILQDACKKLSLDSSQYGLRYICNSQVLTHLSFLCSVPDALCMGTANPAGRTETTIGP